MAADRSTSTEPVELITDPIELAKREAENGLKQAQLAFEVIKSFVKDSERPFKLRQSLLLQLHHKALEGIHPLAGTYRNGPAKITGSKHTPVDAFVVSEEVAHMCDYVNENWSSKSALHLASYILWKLNWIHPFADGNGRTARALSYVVLSIRTDSLLPGTTTIPDFISSAKTPYYDALEAADAAWKEKDEIDLSEVEKLMGALLARQLAQAVSEAEGAPQ